MLLYGAEAWSWILSTDAVAREKSYVRTSAQCELDSELYELLTDIDDLAVVLDWPAEDNAPARRVFDAGICGSRRRV